MIFYMCLIHTDEPRCTITKIQAITNMFSKYGHNFLMRYLESFGQRRKKLDVRMMYNIFQAQTNWISSFLDTYGLIVFTIYVHIVKTNMINQSAPKSISEHSWYRIYILIKFQRYWWVWFWDQLWQRDVLRIIKNMTNNKSTTHRMGSPNNGKSTK